MYLLQPRVRGAAVALTALVTTVTATALVSADSGAGAERSQGPAFQEPFRPQYHFTPAENWMNDPNGLVWHKGEYHLFYQYNPLGTTWGNMSWGHAVSRDLLHWEELDVAIPATDDEHIFSGSAVVDDQNTSGFGTSEDPPMVAIYTSAYPNTGIQAQSLAYSTDRGRTWTKYEGNPVIDIGSNDFRDPKVFWYEEGEYWVMAVTLSVERKVQFYRSDDLKSWDHLSDFGPANAVDGIWEVPDLFELPVDGDPDNTKWVLVVNMNPGSIAGGSGAQYFVGHFDGVEFEADNLVEDAPPPTGHVFEDFEGGDYGNWTVENDDELAPEPFGTAPADGTLPGQQPVTGYLGTGLVNSFLGGDAGRGRMISPTFTIDEDYINLLVGGGNHPYREGTVPFDHIPDGDVIFDFEMPEGQTFEEAGWVGDGDLVNKVAAEGPSVRERGHIGEKLLTTYLDGGDSATGTLTSPEFDISRHHLSMLIGGGGHTGDEPTMVELLVDGRVTRSATGNFSGFLDWTSWDVSDLVGQTARLRVVDQNTGGWGHLLLDHVVATDDPVGPRAIDTSVNLVVDGEVVRTASGEDSERLDWVTWNVRDLAGQEAEIHIRDLNSGGWGHINVDHIMFSDEPAQSVKDQYSWVDYGKDFYAVISWENMPTDERVWIGWMNNWDYAERIPTSPWRSAQSLPRQVGLQTINGEIRLVQQPIKTIAKLRGGKTFTLRNQEIADGAIPLPERARGKTLEIEAEFEAGTAEQFGLVVRQGDDGEGTLIGYDTTTGELYVDRTHSGVTDFSHTFPGRHGAPVSLDGNRIRLKAYVDWSSVEVFEGQGQAVITDQIFPDASSDGLAVFAENGSATLRSLTVRPLKSTVQD
jgi:levanase